MRKTAIGFGVAGYALPVAARLFLATGNEPGHSLSGLFWLSIMLWASVPAAISSFIAYKLGREAYLDLPAPRPLFRKLELGALLSPLVAICSAPVVAFVAVAG